MARVQSLVWSANIFDEEIKDHEAEPFVTDLKTVASYNWLDRTDPTIVIPGTGKPPRWTPLATPRRLDLDDGEYFRDRNSANFPKHPMEPTIVAAVTMQRDIPQQTDVVASGSDIGNLIRFLQGEDKPFRMLVELVGDSVFLIRRENTPRELIPNVQGYGHSFPEAYTTWDSEVKGSTSHQRVITYRFGGLGFLVRHEVDGYIAGDHVDEEDSASSLPSPGHSDDGTELDHLSAAMAGNHVTSRLPEDTHTELKVIRAGKLVSQNQIFDLKTRSFKKKETETLEGTLGGQLKRLWVAQIPNFILAYHNCGVFDEINVRAVQEEVDEWGKSHVDTLSRLAALIHHIIGLVRARSDNRLELRHATVGILEVREQLADAGAALSKDGRMLWENGRDQKACEDSSSVGSDDWDDGFEPDFTACSADDCGYCGRCSY
ncbi:hypothetical protein N0V82_004202 [Gnomoniopsis sp. IMI 355080]|nr:hypothetical protein N0V82_004202 [Gnomoniopsis sp. IMI 355080]